MNVEVFLRGLLIGFSIAAPIGPIGMLCIQRSLAEGRVAGVVSGLGAATADAIYGTMAAFGLTSISVLLVRHYTWLRLLGGIFLCCFGVKIFLSRLPDRIAPTEGTDLWSAYASTFLLTLASPMTILLYTAAVAGLGVGRASEGYGSASALAVGLFLGSGLWWVILGGGVGSLRTRLNPSVLSWLNRISGVVIFGFGLVASLT